MNTPIKIQKISIYVVPVPVRLGSSRKKISKKPQIDDSIIVLMETDQGTIGLGEINTLGTNYMRGWAEAARSGVEILAQHSLGADPLQYDRLNYLWDEIFPGEEYMKAPMDMALWDIMGKVTGRPVCDLLGGRYPGQPPLYRSIYFPPDTSPQPDDFVNHVNEVRQQGFRHFQLKVGRTAGEDIAAIQAVAEILKPDEAIIVDVNTRWTLSQAIQVSNAVRDLPVIIEQPCPTWEECIAFRKVCTLPVKLDEVIETPRDIIRGFKAGAMDMVAIKIGRVGGITKARRMRDLALSLGLTIVPDEVWGSQIASSALLHFAASTHPKHLLCYTDLTDYIDIIIADGHPVRQGGEVSASNSPGLGLEPRMEILGDPVAVID